MQQEDEIDLIELLKTAWNGRKTIVKFLIIFLVLGLFIAIFSAKEYTANTVIIPQTGKKTSGSLVGLAAMAGINLGGNSSNDITPSLYPKVVESVTFKRALLQVPLKFEDIDKEITYQEYYEKYQKFNLLSFIKEYTIGLPGKIIGAIKGKPKEIVEKSSNDDIYKITQDEFELFEQIKNQLEVSSNDKEGFVTLSFSMPEALPAAQMVQKAQELLQKAITEFKVKKATNEFLFIKERCEEAKKDFEKKQLNLANFRDRNRGVMTSRSQTRIEQLQTNYNLAFGVYSELSKKLEMQKITVKENTPSFSILQPVTVPVNKAKPKRLLIIIIWSFLGVVIGVGIVFGKEWIRSLKTKQHKKSEKIK